MWRIDQTQASLNASGLSARVNLQRPDLGIADLVWQGTPVVGARLLQVRRPRSDASQHLVDAYIRGTDLIAMYETRLCGAVATQLYWRYVEHADLCAAGFELIVSVQTELLDDDPGLALISELPCIELFQAAKGDAACLARVPLPENEADGSCRCTGVGLFLYRFGQLPGGYLEMVHPADFDDVEFEPGPNPGILRSRFKLFEEHLEKGVIRRARVRGLLGLDTRDGEAVVGECYRRLLAAESPLSV
jgi:hypothetical protein